jgi:hypothetical protein
MWQKIRPNRAHRRVLVLTYPFELLPTGAVCFDMCAIRLVGGVVADQVMREGIYKHSNIGRVTFGVSCCLDLARLTPITKTQVVFCCVRTRAARQSAARRG